MLKTCKLFKKLDRVRRFYEIFHYTLEKASKHKNENLLWERERVNNNFHMTMTTRRSGGSGKG